jgi:hypothetical protein
MLLLILPFGCGYLCKEDGEPCEYSLRVTMMLQTALALTDPHKTKHVEIN